MPDARDHYRHYVTGFTRLSLWHVRRRVLQGLDTFDDALNVRVNIFRNTSLADGKRHPADGHVIPEWSALLERFRAVFDRRAKDDDTTALEDEGLAIFWPVLEARVNRTGNGKTNPADRPYESWSCDYRGDDRINIHIANVYKPESPLVERRDHFAAALIRLLRDSQVNRPDVLTVACGSWLNSVPAFLDLFPPVWLDGATTSTTHNYTLGTWGQFMDRRGAFHEKNGARMRELGTFPYPSVRCRAPIADTLAHLESKFPKAVARNADLGYTPGKHVAW
jgi:hypothetical protein